jgi:catechol 2,3-dioxygenase-like lactoylglutathione lyase family enzyme
MDSKNKTIFEPSRIFQAGIVVKSVDQTVKFYEETFGMGPFEIREVNYPTATFYGEKSGYRGKRAFGKLGPITFELVDLIDGKTIHEAFLKERGEGLHHLGFEVEDLKGSTEEADRRGLKVIQGFTRDDGSGFAYPDSDKIGGVIFELIQKAPRKV